MSTKQTTPKSGILVHSRHLQTEGWERLMWGTPADGRLGSLTKATQLLLMEPIDLLVLGDDPSTKDGLSEGEYKKRFWLENMPGLREFPQFKNLSDDALEKLRSQIEAAELIKIERTIDEIVLAAKLFEEKSITRVFQVTSASHAPRCIQLQAAMRAEGKTPLQQNWFLAADDQCYENADPLSTQVLEPPHRADDPMLGVHPSLPELLKDYHYKLTPSGKRQLIKTVSDFIGKKADVD